MKKTVKKKKRSYKRVRYSEVHSLLAKGWTLKQIASHLGISNSTASRAARSHRPFTSVKESAVSDKTSASVVLSLFPDTHPARIQVYNNHSLQGTVIITKDGIRYRRANGKAEGRTFSWAALEALSKVGFITGQ